MHWYSLISVYSTIAIVGVIVTSFLMPAGLFLTSWRRLLSAMPVVGNCSLTIAAACHQPDGDLADPETPLAPLKWGVVRTEGQEPQEGSYRHCGFSSEDADEPQAQIMYT